MPKSLIIPGYYERQPADLLSSDLHFDVDSAVRQRTAAAASYLLRRIEDHDPERLMDACDGPAVRVSNHRDFADPMAIGINDIVMSHYPARFLAMAELFGDSLPMRLARIGSIVKECGGIPLDRDLIAGGNRRAITQLNKLSSYVLKDLNQALILFPEGGLGQGNRIDEINSGAVAFARRNKVPLIVHGIAGSRYSLVKALIPFGAPRLVIYTHEAFGPDEKVSADRLKESMQQAFDIARDIAA